MTRRPPSGDTALGESVHPMKSGLDDRTIGQRREVRIGKLVIVRREVRDSCEGDGKYGRMGNESIKRGMDRSLLG